MTAASTTSKAIWQPYLDDPLLTPAMTGGSNAVPAAELDALRRYLEALVLTRQAPVHVAVAFNAAYFGYDLGGEGYGNSPVDPDVLPRIEFGGRVPALPVGSMVHIVTGSTPLYAEIVYKEGRHPRIGALGEVPGWVSGAPAGAEGPGTPCSADTPVRRELLVPDLRAFGSGLAPTRAQLTRLRDRARWIDHHGHVSVDAEYPSADAAWQDGVSAYAAHLLTTARSQLLNPLVPKPLAALAGGHRPEALHAALLQLLELIRQVLASSDTLRMWGLYAVSRQTLAAWWGDKGPLGGTDMGALATSLHQVTTPTARRRYALPTATTAYTAVGPRLYAFRGAEARLDGVDYAAAVCRANLAVSDVIRRESDNGLFANGTRVTLDDAFESGGIWRSHTPGGDEPTGDPLVAAGRGWRATVEPAAEQRATEQPAEPVDLPLSDDADLGTSHLDRVSGSETTWRMPLRLAHIVGGYLPLHRLVADELRDLHGPQPTVRLELTHPGGELEEWEAVQDTRAELGDRAGRLLGIDWPLDFFPGLELHLQWPKGGRVVRATTTPLATPVTVGERTIEHRYDAAVLTREDAPGTDRTRDSPHGLDPRRLVMRAVRRCGLLTHDGHALLDRARLGAAVYGAGPTPTQVAALDAAVDELLAAGELYPDTGSRGADGHPHYPPRADEQEIPLVGYRPDPLPAPRSPAPPGADSYRAQRSVPVAAQQVVGHLRRLRTGHSASDEQRAAFRTYCQQLGLAGTWELPDHYTFVHSHTRGH